MSEHFDPGKVAQLPVSRRERRRLRRMFDVPPPRRTRLSGTTVGVVLAAAACAGLAVGLSGGGPPTATATSTAASTPLAIPFFGFCPHGGGTNCVVDGDTFYYGRDKIRIANIDAPETHPPSCAEEDRLGSAATDRLRALLNSGEISLRRIDRDEDMYGRKLRNVAVDGADVGAALVSAGLARDYAGGRKSWC